MNWQIEQKINSNVSTRAASLTVTKKKSDKENVNRGNLRKDDDYKLKGKLKLCSHQPDLKVDVIPKAE